jgi:hypothetical protein
VLVQGPNNDAFLAFFQPQNRTNYNKKKLVNKDHSMHLITMSHHHIIKNPNYQHPGPLQMREKKKLKNTPLRKFTITVYNWPLSINIVNLTTNSIEILGAITKR